jgi:phosphate:Na+ symporter
VAWPLLISSTVVGIGLLFVQKYRVIRTICFAMSGFSGVLIGIAMMQSITPWLIDHGMFQAFVAYAHQNVLAGILSGAIMAAVLHSSAATIAIAMSLAGAGALSLPLAIAIVLGANIGTCATGLLAAIGASRPAQLVAYSQLVLNVSGTLLFIPLIEPLQTIVQHLTTNPASQVAHAQTIFNVVCSLLVLPLCYLPVFQKN